ncbi:MAG: type II toxin-antitoxin system VapC family toxin [Terracidiphilus sp.]
MRLVLDASAALAWFVQRFDPGEAALADEILTGVEREEAVVPALWFIEVVNGLLVAERNYPHRPSRATRFLAELAAMPIAEDRVRPTAQQGEILTLARMYGLTSYDAVYLELVLRTGRTLATFDRQLADAVRKAGGQVFGDAAWTGQ